MVENIETRISWYKLFFYGISLMYFFISLILYKKSTTFACSFLIGNCNQIKLSFVWGTALIAIASFGIGMFLHPARELSRLLYQKEREHLRNLYLDEAHSGLRKGKYRQLLSKMEDYYQVSKNLLKTIYQQKEKKEGILEQAIEEIEKHYSKLRATFDK